MSRNGSQLDNMLKGGSARINELSEAANRLGIVLSPELILHAEETSHKLESLKMVLSAQIAGVVAQNASAILSLSSALATLTGSIIRFLGSNPQLALGIVGALLGGRVGGLPGAVLGGAAGALLGGKVAQNADEMNDDLAVRRQQLIAARDRLHSAESSGGAGPAMSVAGIQTGGGAGPNVGQLRNDLQHQVDRYYQAIAAAKAANAPPPKGPDIPKFLAEKGPKKKTPDDKNEEDAFKFAQEERQLNLQILEAKRALVHDVSDQAEVSLQMLDVQRQIRDADIDHKVAQAKKDLAEKKITQSTYNQIITEAGIEKAKEADLVGLQRKAILDERDQRLLQESIQLDEHGYDLRKEMLQKQADLAQTQSERRKIELQILDLAYKEKRIILDRIIAESKDPIAVAQARQDRAALDKNYTLDRQGVIQQTRGPLEQYMAGLPTDAAKWQEALQNVAVNGFGALEQAILDTVNGTKKLGAAFADMAKSIIADLIKIGLERTIIAPLANALFGGAQGGGLGGLLGGLLGGVTGGGGLGGAMPLSGSLAGGASVLGSIPLSGAFASLPGFDSGGSMRLKGNMGTDRNTLAVNGIPIARVGYGERLDITPKGGGSSGSGDHFHINAPITINSPVTRETAGQLARDLNAHIAQARRKGF
jgi:hypothetical protein